jgi:hypothetical protein
LKANRILLLVVGVGLALTSITYIAPSIAFYPVSAIILVVGLVLCWSFWILSSPTKTNPITRTAENFSRNEVMKMRPKVEAAAAGFTSSRVSVASILRQRLVNRHYGVVTPAPAWATTAEERSPIIEILGDKTYLLDVFEPNERDEPRKRFLRRPRLDTDYVEKLERALSFLEEGEI